MEGVERHLHDQLERRERLIKDSRDVISRCSRAIISVHNGKMPQARKELDEAKKMLTVLRKAGEGAVSRYLVSPETEFVEASTVISLVNRKGVPSRASLEATPEAYLLGLLDTIGELKRLVLDSVIEGDLERAASYFATMESLYSICSPLAVYDHVVSGTRRKIDVARILVEDTRSVLAEEASRKEMISAMKALSGRLTRASR